MTLDILFTYLTMDERKEGWGSKALWALKGILISKNEGKAFLRGLELDGYQTPSCVGDISDNDTIKFFDRKYDLLNLALSQQK